MANIISNSSLWSSSSSSSAPHPIELSSKAAGKEEAVSSSQKRGEALAFGEYTFSEIEALTDDAVRVIVQDVTNNGEDLDKLLRMMHLNSRLRGFVVEIAVRKWDYLLEGKEPEEAWDSLLQYANSERKDLGKLLCIMVNADRNWSNLIEGILKTQWEKLLGGMTKDELKKIVAGIPEDSSYFSRFVSLRSRLAEDGCPLEDFPGQPIGFSTEAWVYNKYQDGMDIALGIVWKYILSDKFFDLWNKPVPNARSGDIRRFLSEISEEDLKQVKMGGGSNERIKGGTIEIRGLGDKFFFPARANPNAGKPVYFTVLPPEMRRFTQLVEHFRVIQNPYLRSLPAAIGSFSQLRTLDLSRNQLSDLPKKIGELRELTDLDLSGNKFERFPRAICELGRLTRLNLSDNQLRCLPPEISRLVRLTLLYIAGNSFESLPQEIGSLPSLIRVFHSFPRVSFPSASSSSEEEPQSIFSEEHKEELDVPMEEEKSVDLVLSTYATTIDSLSDDALYIIFSYATNDGKDLDAVLQMMDVNKRFRSLAGKIVLKKWDSLLEGKTPDEAWPIILQHARKEQKDLGKLLCVMVNADWRLRDLIEQIMEKQWKKMVPGIQKEELKKFVAGMAEDPSYFRRFVNLRRHLAEDGCPLESSEVGFTTEALDLDLLQDRIDISLRILWKSLREILVEEGVVSKESIPGPEARSRYIREWLNNPQNMQIITDKLDNLEFFGFFHWNHLSLTVGPNSNAVAHFASFPREMCGLAQLRKLKLTRGEHLVSLPPQIGNLLGLRDLNLSDNCLGKVPREIGNLISLTRLDLSGNRLKALPPTIGQLGLLEQLDVSSNAIGSLPSEITDLVKLKDLKLRKNQLKALPPTIGKLNLLEQLDVSSNAIGILPLGIADLVELKSLKLQENYLVELPQDIGRLIHLTKLDFSKNRLQNIPPSIGDLHDLKHLQLSRNALSDIPASIGNLIHLTELDLSVNRLQNIPASIGNLSQLEMLDVSSNKLTCLPFTISDLSQLKTIRLYGNPLIFMLDSQFEANIFDDFEGYDFEDPLADRNPPVLEVKERLKHSSTYRGRSPLTSLCRAIHYAEGDDVLEKAFRALPLDMQSQIQEKIPSSEAGAGLFADRAVFVQAVISALKKQWRSFSSEQRKQIYVNFMRSTKWAEKLEEIDAKNQNLGRLYAKNPGRVDKEKMLARAAKKMIVHMMHLIFEMESYVNSMNTSSSSSHAPAD